MKKEQWAKEQSSYTPDPLTKDLPATLKDPKCFKRVLKKVADASETGHEHKTILQWKVCKHCQQKFLERRAVVKKLGFASYEQFLKWKKITDIIINKREVRILNKK